MLAAFRPLALALALLPPSSEARPAPAPRSGDSTFTLPGQDPVEPFVPLHPRTAEDQARIDALLGYVSARALEDQGRAREAIAQLEQALEKDPDSIATLRRLSRLCFGLGRIRQAIDYSRRVVEADPGDTTTLAYLIEYYKRKGDFAASEALLNGVLAHPKLDRSAPASLLVEAALGDLYARRPGQLAKAADAYAKVVDGLDARAAARLSPADQKRILGDNEAEAYQKFGDAFLKARRFDLAIKSYRRGLVYEPDSAELPQKLAQAQWKAGRPAEALATLEPILKGKPSGQEAFELMAQILTALKRPDEILPRLEAAAQADPGNAALQYALADRLREAGQVAKADALYKALLKHQPDPQGLAARSEALRKQKKNAELLKLFEEALAPEKQPGGLQAILPQIESITTDPDYAGELLAEGLRLLQADPPGLGRQGRMVLASIATKVKDHDRLIALSRLAVKQDPNPTTLAELAQALLQGGKPDEAAATLESLLEKYPDRKTAQSVLVLGQYRLQAGQNEAALKAAREALTFNPDDYFAMNLAGLALSRLDRNDEAVAQYKAILERFPGDDDATRVAHSGLSNVYVNMGEFDKGEAELELLLARDPDDDGINNDLGYLYADRGKNLEKAEAMIRKAMEEKPEYAAYLDSLGWVLFKRGRVREAVEPLEKASQSNIQDATIYDHLGDVYFRLQEHAKARAAWERAESLAVRSHPPDKRLPEIRKKLEALSKVAPAPKAASDANP